jgi:hypothetical protein
MGRPGAVVRAHCSRANRRQRRHAHDLNHRAARDPAHKATWPHGDKGFRRLMCTGRSPAASDSDGRRVAERGAPSLPSAGCGCWLLSSSHAGPLGAASPSPAAAGGCAWPPAPRTACIGYGVAQAAPAPGAAPLPFGDGGSGTPPSAARRAAACGGAARRQSTSIDLPTTYRCLWQ